MFAAALLAAAAVAPAAFAAEIAGASITNPTASRWWIAESQVELAWTGDVPPDFVAWIHNSNASCLASGTAQLSGITAAYNRGSLIDPLQTGIFPCTNYTITLSNAVNMTDVYVTSEAFEVKPKGSTYPATPSASVGDASATANSSASGTSAPTSAAAAESSKTGGAEQLGAPVVAAVMGGLAYFLL